jgi:aminomethyltransferase
MSTNDLAGMQPGEMRETVLTTAVAQIVDVVTVVVTEHSGLLVTSPGRARRVRDWLQGHIFFQDDVRLHEIEGWESWGLYGPRARRESARIVPMDTSGPARTWTVGAAWEVERPAGGGTRLLLAPEAAAEARRLWGGEWDGAAEAYDTLRIEAGIPETGIEIVDDSLPLEVGLKGAVSFTKGCYIGQEIIARMESRGRLAKELLGVRAEEAMSARDVVVQDGRPVGTVTSAARSPRLGAIALASVRPAALEKPGGAILIGDRKVRGRLVRLPFEPVP